MSLRELRSAHRAHVLIFPEEQPQITNQSVKWGTRKRMGLEGAEYEGGFYFTPNVAVFGVVRALVEHL